MNAFELERVVAGLRDARERWRSAQHRPRELGMRELPDRAHVAEVADAQSAAIFLVRLGPCRRGQRITPWTLATRAPAAARSSPPARSVEARRQAVVACLRSLRT